MFSHLFASLDHFLVKKWTIVFEIGSYFVAQSGLQLALYSPGCLGTHSPPETVTVGILTAFWFFFFVLFFALVPGMKPRALHMLDKDSIAELQQRVGIWNNLIWQL